MLDAGTRLAAQSNPTDVAVNEAVIRQAKTVDLRQKLADAKKATDAGDLRTAAKDYQEAKELVLQIGSGIDLERSQTMAGLAYVWLTLAREAQRAGSYHEADTDVLQVLNFDPKNAEALAFKRQNDRLIESLKGRIPDNDTLDQIPAAIAQRREAGTLVQDGRVFYEMGNLDAAEQHYQAAKQVLETLRGRLHGEELKISFMKNRFEAYENLIGICLARDTTAGTQDAKRRPRWRRIQRATSPTHAAPARTNGSRAAKVDWPSIRIDAAATQAGKAGTRSSAPRSSPRAPPNP